jgi:hypothetical protein
MGGPDAELGLGKEFEHGGGAEMRGRVAIDFERFRDPSWSGSARRVLFERPLEIVERPLTLATIAASARRGLISARYRRRWSRRDLRTLPSGRVT